MPVAFLILSFSAGAFLGLLTMSLACAAHDREEFRRVDTGRRPVVDRRYIEVELARRHRLRSRAGWVGGSGSVTSSAPH
jgi:hypothetical protein